VFNNSHSRRTYINNPEKGYLVNWNSSHGDQVRHIPGRFGKTTNAPKIVTKEQIIPRTNDVIASLLELPLIPSPPRRTAIVGIKRNTTAISIRYIMSSKSITRANVKTSPNMAEIKAIMLKTFPIYFVNTCFN